MKLESWKTRHLSMVGRQELIISTLSSYHLFWSLTFPLPIMVIKDIERTYRDFLWGNMKKNKHVHTVTWVDITLIRLEGGLGIYKLDDMVKARLIKNLQNIATKRECVWVNWVHAKYLRESSVLEVPIPWTRHGHGGKLLP